MKPNTLLVIASVLSVLFMTFHLTDDIVRGMEPGTLVDLIAVPILVFQLYGTLALAGKRSGYVIILIGSLLLLVVPVVHMKGAGVGGAIANSNGAFFFVWTLLALGTTGLFSLILAVRGLRTHKNWNVVPAAPQEGQ
jgi:riboflavin transporter FmnP